jgi:hypothetical protein
MQTHNVLDNVPTVFRGAKLKIRDFKSCQHLMVDSRRFFSIGYCIDPAKSIFCGQAAGVETVRQLRRNTELQNFNPMNKIREFIQHESRDLKELFKVIKRLFFF